MHRSWNGALFESHYMFNPQVILINRYELVRMSQQAFSTNPSNLGQRGRADLRSALLPVHFEPRGICLPRGIRDYLAERRVTVVFTPLATSSLLFGFDFDF